MNMIPFILSLNSTAAPAPALRQVQSLASVAEQIVPYGTAFNDVVLPSQLMATFTDGSTDLVSIDWLEGSYDPDIGDTYTITGEVVLPSPGIGNDAGVTASASVIVSAALLDVSTEYETFTGAQSHCGILSQAHYLYSPRSKWHDYSGHGKTFFSFQGPHDSDGFALGYVIEYSEKDGIKRPVRINTPNAASDSHTTPTFDLDADGDGYMFQERTHDTPIDIHRTLGANLNLAELLAEKIGTGGEFSYVQTFLDESGNGVCVFRTGALFVPTAGGHLCIAFASSGLEGWGTPIRLTTNPRPDLNAGVEANKTRHYPCQFWYRQIVGDYIYFGMTQRDDDPVTFLGDWNKYYTFRIHKTNFKAGTHIVENHNGSFSQNVASANYLIEATLDANYLMYNTGAATNNGFMPIWTISAAGDIYGIHGETNTGSLLLNRVVGGVHEVIDLNIAGYPIHVQESQNAPVSHLCYIGNYLEIGIHIGVHPNRQTHLFRTYDHGDNWIDGGALFPEVADESKNVVFPINYPFIPDNRNFLIVAFADDTVTANRQVMYMKRVAKVALQSETPSTITAASSYSDIFNLFQYKGDASAVVKTGNNITSLTDQFGLRNATGGNSPQWDGADNSINLNGTSHFFTISSTGLTALTKITIFAVVKGPLIVLSLNNSSLSASRCYFIAGNSGSPNVVYKEQALVTLSEDPLEVANDGTYHLVSWQADGRTAYRMRINGQPCFYRSSNYSTLAHYQTRGKINYGTVNAVHIGLLNTSGTDTLSAGSFKFLMAKSTCYSEADYQAFEKKVADEFSITLNYGYL